MAATCGYSTPCSGSSARWRRRSRPRASAHRRHKATYRTKGGADGPTAATRTAIARLLEPAIRERTTAEWLERLVPQGIWAAPINSYEETFADPAIQAADAVEEIRRECGYSEAEISRLRTSGTV